MKYSKAPISECICGIAFKHSIFSDDEVFKINSELSNKFPTVTICAPLIIEKYEDGQIQPIFTPDVTGQILYRRKTRDKKWLMQIQKNILYLNWIRTDGEMVGSYVGFSTVFKQFIDLINDIEEIVKKDIRKQACFYDLTYRDRIELDSADKTNEISDVLTVSIPSDACSGTFDSFAMRNSFSDKDLNGFGIMDINTAVTIEQKRVLNLGLILRGQDFKQQIETWFDEAHKQQLTYFEKMVQPAMLEQWK